MKESQRRSGSFRRLSYVVSALICVLVFQIYGGEPYAERYVIPSMSGDMPNEVSPMPCADHITNPQSERDASRCVLFVSSWGTPYSYTSSSSPPTRVLRLDHGV